MKDRIRKLMESQHMTQQTFAEFLGISAATVSGIFNDRTRPTLALVEAIKQKMKNINTDWLLFGTGEMFLSNVPSENAPTSTPMPSHQGEKAQQADLFSSSPSPTNTSDAYPTMVNMEEIAPYGGRPQGSQYRPYKPQAPQSYASQPTDNSPRRQITEIRIFYSDQTWETFVPKK